MLILFCRNWQADSKIHGQNNLKKEESWKTMTTWFSDLLQMPSYQDRWHQARQTDQRKRLKSKNRHSVWTINVWTDMQRQFIGAKIFFSTNSAEKSG